MKRKISQILSVAVLATMIANCGKKKSEEESTDSNSSFPQIGAINMSGPGGKATALTGASTDCDNVSAKLGIAGMSLGAACHVSELVESLTTGNNADVNDDGKINCADYDLMTNKDDAGMMLLLLCNKDIIAQGSIKSLGFEETGSAGGISFEDANPTDGKTAKGSWTAGSADNYPGDIRIWTGASFSAASGMLAMQLTTEKSGQMYLDGAAFGSKFKIWVQYDFSAVDNSLCKASPSKSNCYWLEAKAADNGDSTSNDGPPSGFHMIAYAGGLTSADGQPDFLSVQGHYVYTAALAATTFGSSGLSTVREIKMKSFVDMTKEQVWGSYEFLDATGISVTSISGSTAIVATLKAGVCQDLGKESIDATCKVIPATYTSFWDTSFAKVNYTDSVTNGFDFSTGKPTAEGVVKAFAPN